MGKNTDCVIDIETTGLSPQAGIVSIGLAFFNWKTLELGNTYQIQVHKCADNAIRDHDEGVMDWWNSDKVCDVARQQLTNYELMKGYSLMEALIMLDKIIDDEKSESIKVWGNGSVFDMVIIEDAYKQLKMKVPWHFRCINDVRTSLRTFKRFKIKNPTMKTMEGNGHVAHDDAIHERHVLVNGYTKLDEIAEKAWMYDDLIWQ